MKMPYNTSLYEDEISSEITYSKNAIINLFHLSQLKFKNTECNSL